MSEFKKAIEESQKEDTRKYCQFKCSKYCEIVDWDMSTKHEKFVCKACYNCAVK